MIHPRAQGALRKIYPANVPENDPKASNDIVRPKTDWDGADSSNLVLLQQSWVWEGFLGGIRFWAIPWFWGDWACQCRRSKLW
ncbi:MAG: hypothetical protein DWH88_00770 [Planctomycetota bacterium]|nr:MAG: hypothetical protein DWH88_00770 [Planctomycetota bacterium]